MLFISGGGLTHSTSGDTTFQSRNRDAFQVRFIENATGTPRQPVSISQSRGFSFQAGAFAPAAPCPKSRFNLAIERLFISGWRQFGDNILHTCFNLAIERLFISGDDMSAEKLDGFLFQSRNREAFHFRQSIAEGMPVPALMFQSRNREAFHFRTLPPAPVKSLS